MTKRSMEDIGLTVDKYNEMKSEGKLDCEIMMYFGISASGLSGWKRKNNLIKTKKISIDDTGITVEKYKKMKEEGKTHVEIAKHFGVSPSGLSGWKERNNLIMKDQRNLKEKGLTKDKYKKLKKEGYFDKDICEMYKCSTSSLVDWKKRNGLKTKEYGALDRMGEDKYNELKKEGLMDKEIAAQLGITQNAVVRWKNRKGIETHRQSIEEKLTPEQYKEYKEKGLDEIEICKLIKCSTTTLQKFKRKHNLFNLKLVITKEEYEIYKEEGLTDEEIAECIYNVTPYYFSKRLLELGLREPKSKRRKRNV